MRLLLAALFFGAIVTRVDAHVGETLDHLKARIDAATIFGEATLPDGTIVLHLKRTDHIYSNIRFTPPHHVASFEQFSKYDYTELSDDDIDTLLHEEPSPDKWRPFEMEHVAPHEKMWINDDTKDIALLAVIKVGPDNHLARFLDISPGPDTAPLQTLLPSPKRKPASNEDHQPPPNVD